MIRMQKRSVKKSNCGLLLNLKCKRWTLALLRNVLKRPTWDKQMKITRHHHGKRFTSKTLATGDIYSSGFGFAGIGQPPIDCHISLRADDNRTGVKIVHEVRIESVAEAVAIRAHLDDFIQRVKHAPVKRTVPTPHNTPHAFKGGGACRFCTQCGHMETAPIHAVTVPR